MSIADSISRFTAYYRRNGLWTTLRRAGLSAKRALFSSRMVVFYCDLDPAKLSPVDLPKNLEVKRLETLTQLSREHLEEITSFWHRDLAARNIRERFDKGASLWLIASGNKLAGYGWSLRGRTIEPYYFPLGPDDVHLFDFQVFPEYRGQGLNPRLVTHILNGLAASGGGRAYIEAAEWNDAQLASLRKTPFRYFGRVRPLTILSRNLVKWTASDPATHQRLGVEEGSLKPDSGISSDEHSIASHKKGTADGAS